MLPSSWVVCYDIHDDGRRRHVDRILRGAGRRVQESVFECRLTIGVVVETKRRLERVIDRTTDSVRWYRLCDACAERTGHLDVRPAQRDYGFTIV